MKVLITILILLLARNTYSQAPLKQISSSVSRLDSIEKSNNKSVKASGKNINQAIISLKDSTFNLHANIRKDHRFFGYANPDVRSKKLVLFSVFTADVEQNPFNCEFGAYYDTTYLSLGYIATIGNFVKVSFKEKDRKSTMIYFEKKWVSFEKS